MYSTEPIVANETVYLAVTTDRDFNTSEGYVGAYNIETGEQLWKRTDLTAPRTPVFSDGQLYVAMKRPPTPDSDMGGFYVLNAESGETEWTHPATQEWSSPIVTDRHVYTVSDNGVYALDRAAGNPIWETDGVGGITDGIGDALSYNNKTIFCNDGTPLNAENGPMKWCVADDQGMHGNHAINDDTIYYIRTEYIVGDDSSVSITVRSADDGTMDWRYKSNSNGWDRRLAVTDNYVLFLDENDDEMTVVKALDAETGTSVWTAEVNGSYLSSPTVANETVYVGGRYTPDWNRWNGRAVIYAIDLETGDRKWLYLLNSSDFETSPKNPPTAGTPVVADDNLFTATYPSGSTLDYQYIFYSNFFVLESVLNS